MMDGIVRFMGAVALLLAAATASHAEDNRHTAGFLFETGDGYGHIYTTRNYALEEMDNPPPSGDTQYPAKLYYYNLKDNTYAEIAYTDAKKMNLFVNRDPLKGNSSPDGMLGIFTYSDNSHDVISAMLSAAVNLFHDKTVFYLSEEDGSRKLKLPANSPALYNPRLIAWVVE